MNLLSFVNEKHYRKLIDTLILINSDDIRDKISIINIHGDYSSGKTTLIEIMKLIRGDENKKI